MNRLILSAAAMLVLSTTAGAATLMVPGQHGTIQGAINAAQNGDTILVSPGTYHESINMAGKSLTLRSVSGAAATIIDASGLGTVSVIRCTSGEGPLTVVDGFTITGGSGTLENGRKKGGGMFNRQSSPTVRNCLFQDNTLTAYGSGVTASGAGMYNELASPTVSDCTFSGNELLGCSGWLNGGAGMYNDQCSPSVVRCRFLGNAGNNGGGMMNVSGGNPLVESCLFENNDATFSGGGLNNTGGASATVVNCLFRGNSAYHGAGMYTTSSTIAVANCTVSGNVADNTGGGIYLMYAPTSCGISNSIFRGNTAVANPAGKEIARYQGAFSTVNNCNVQGGWTGPGWANIDADPLFVNPAAGDFRLDDASPSVDSGLNLSVPQGVSTDLDGLSRVVNATVDMGAYEVQGGAGSCAGDLSGNGTVDVQDLIALFADWGACGACNACEADLSGDCMVNVVDLIALFDDWGACP